MCCSNIVWVPEGPNVYSQIPKQLVTAPAEPDVAAARKKWRSAGARFQGEMITINIWSLRDPDKVRATHY
jgi:hypothetical protein